MKLRHATPARNLRSIRRRGLLTAQSQCKQPVIWLHAANRSAWAVLHTMQRHTSNNVVVIVRGRDTIILADLMPIAATFDWHKQRRLWRRLAPS